MNYTSQIISGELVHAEYERVGFPPSRIIYVNKDGVTVYDFRAR